IALISGSEQTPSVAKAMPTTTVAPIAPPIPLKTSEENKAAEEKANAKLQPAIAKVEVKPAPKVKPKVTPKPKRKVIRSLAYTRKHSVSRSDKSKVNSKRSHEFRGGKHLFYPELKEKSWFKSSKRGETLIEFKNPVRLSKIVIHKASVGRLNFNHGYLRLEIQSSSGKWKRLFERKDDDLDVKVTIRNVQKHMKKIKAVRLKFKTPEPITIGPIDLLP
ncbi:MAG: hypothetical protein Q9M19_09195, partial [Mariprofundaceae bacterium]|nr:hypothetical protein [Mariprofundaceae bacterium]